MQNKISIPYIYENGTYILKDIIDKFDIQEDTECYNIYLQPCEVLANEEENFHLYTISQFGINTDEDLLNAIKVTYDEPCYDSNQKLKSVHIIDRIKNVEIPFFYNYKGSRFWSLIDEVNGKIQECIEEHTADFLEQIKEKITEPISEARVYYFIDGQAFHISLVINQKIDIYSNDNELECLCTGVNKDYEFTILSSVVMGVHNKLLYELPKNFKVTDDFKMPVPLMYD